MQERKAFREALITVGVASLIVWGVLIPMVGVSEVDWFAYAVLIAVSFAGLLALVYRRNRKSLRPVKLTPRQSLAYGTIFAYFATVQLVAIFFEASGWRALFNCGLGISWLALVLDHLRRARQSKQVAQTYS